MDVTAAVLELIEASGTGFLLGSAIHRICEGKLDEAKELIELKQRLQRPEPSAPSPRQPAATPTQKKPIQPRERVCKACMKIKGRSAFKAGTDVCFLCVKSRRAGTLAEAEEF